MDEAIQPASASSEGASSEGPSADVLARGAQAWSTGMCSKCHGVAAKGGIRAPDLTDDTWLHIDGSVPAIRALLVTGVPRDRLIVPDRPFPMNPVPRLVPDEDALDALAVYVAHLSEAK